MTDGSIFAIELDLRSRNPEQRTCHFFFRGVQQKLYFTHVPQSVKFAVLLSKPGDSIQFVSLSELPTTTTGIKSDSTPYNFEGEPVSYYFPEKSGNADHTDWAVSTITDNINTISCFWGNKQKEYNTKSIQELLEEIQTPSFVIITGHYARVVPSRDMEKDEDVLSVGQVCESSLGWCCGISSN